MENQMNVYVRTTDENGTGFTISNGDLSLRFNLTVKDAAIVAADILESLREYAQKPIPVSSTRRESEIPIYRDDFSNELT